MEKKIFNGTPHEISIVVNSRFATEIRKFIVEDGTEPEIVKSIPSNGMLSAKVNSVDGEPINGIPVFDKSIDGCDALPEGYDIYIVSAMYASAARNSGIDMSKIYTVADPVYTADGKTILGSRGICRAF